jgi:four helix bundle protein
MDKNDLKNRTKAFALRVIKLVKALPKTTEGRAIGMQIIRSGTSVAANYRAACRGRSIAEFISKLGIVIEEADETELWLELISESSMLKAHQVQELIQEAHEIVAIMTSSVFSASKRLKK